jgi:hypothetical protein
VLLTAALAAMLMPLNSTMIAVALPDVMRDLHASVGATTWLVSGYLIAQAALQPLAGKLGDRYGRRPLILSGLVVFAAASAGAAVAPSIGVLIAFRSHRGACASGPSPRRPAPSASATWRCTGRCSVSRCSWPAAPSGRPRASGWHSPRCPSPGDRVAARERLCDRVGRRAAAVTGLAVLTAAMASLASAGSRRRNGAPHRGAAAGRRGDRALERGGPGGGRRGARGPRRRRRVRHLLHRPVRRGHSGREPRRRPRQRSRSRSRAAVRAPGRCGPPLGGARRGPSGPPQSPKPHESRPRRRSSGICGSPSSGRAGNGSTRRRAEGPRASSRTAALDRVHPPDPLPRASHASCPRATSRRPAAGARGASAVAVASAPRGTPPPACTRRGARVPSPGGARGPTTDRGGL